MTGLLFREHRGALTDSMKTTVPLSGWSDLLSVLRALDYVPPFAEHDVAVTWYAHDPRIDWDTYLVTVRGNAVGYTNGPCFREVLAQ